MRASDALDSDAPHLELPVPHMKAGMHGDAIGGNQMVRYERT